MFHLIFFSRQANIMNSLASILYSSSPANTKKRKNLSLQPTIKPASTKPSRCLFRSSTPKTPLQTRTKTTIGGKSDDLIDYERNPFRSESTVKTKKSQLCVK